MANERIWMDRVLADPANISERIVYADWLDEQDEPARANFLRQLSTAMVSMKDLPDPENVPQPWRRAARLRPPQGSRECR